MRRVLFFLVATAVSLSACGKGSSVPAGSQATLSAAAVQNLIDFPLYAGSTVLAAKQFTQTVSSGQTGTGMLAAGAGTYDGHEVVAGSGASFSDLRSWLRQIEKQPPNGYAALATPTSMASVKDIAEKSGIDFAVFRDAKNPKRGLLVVAMDPSAANKKLGPAIKALRGYQELPAVLRQNIDAGVKKRTGFSITEITQPGSPLGIAIGALSQFQDRNERALLVVDAAKQ